MFWQKNNNIRTDDVKTTIEDIKQSVDDISAISQSFEEIKTVNDAARNDIIAITQQLTAVSNHATIELFMVSQKLSGITNPGIMKDFTSIVYTIYHGSLGWVKDSREIIDMTLTVGNTYRFTIMSEYQFNICVKLFPEERVISTGVNTVLVSTEPEREAAVVHFVMISVDKTIVIASIKWFNEFIMGHPVTRRASN